LMRRATGEFGAIGRDVGLQSAELREGDCIYLGRREDESRQLYVETRRATLAPRQEDVEQRAEPLTVVATDKVGEHKDARVRRGSKSQHAAGSGLGCCASRQNEHTRK
jgi:hypothetical protein